MLNRLRLRRPCHQFVIASLRAARPRIGMLAAVITLVACGRPAAADPTYKVNKGVSAGNSYTFTIDFDSFGGGKNSVDVTVSVPAGGADLGATDVAASIAKQVNNKYPTGNYASSDGASVKIRSGGESFQPGNLPKNSITFADADIKPFGGDIRFAPDLVTGNDVLTSAGSYTLSGPGGLSAMFDAPIGTTGDQLAIQLSAVLTGQGYSASAFGNDVVFATPGPGEFDFTPNGTGIDYTMTAAPEISALSSALIGSAIALGYALQRRRRAVTAS